MRVSLRQAGRQKRTARPVRNQREGSDQPPRSDPRPRSGVQGRGPGRPRPRPWGAAELGAPPQALGNRVMPAARDGRARRPRPGNLLSASHARERSPGAPRPAVPTSGREALREHLHGGDARHLYLAVIVPVPVQKQEPAGDRGVRATALRGSRHPVPGEKHPPSPLVAGKTADHRVRLLGVPESHEEGGSCGGAQT